MKQLFAAQYRGHGDLGVVVEYPRGNAAEVSERPHMAFQKRFRGLGRERHDEAVVRVRKVHRKVVRLPRHSGDHGLVSFRTAPTRGNGPSTPPTATSLSI